jgi:hypothetical protein
MADAGIVGAGFAASLGHVLWVIEAWVGITVTGCTVIVVLWCLAATRGQQEEHAATRPSRVIEVGERPMCPWCETRRCTDSSLCNCAVPCGSWLCVVKEASR